MTVSGMYIRREDPAMIMNNEHWSTEEFYADVDALSLL